MNDFVSPQRQRELPSERREEKPPARPVASPPLSVASVLAIQRTAGNQAAAKLAQSTIGGHRAPASVPLLQRMIVVGDPKADIGRLVAVHNLNTRFPGHAVEYLAAADLASMKPFETLYISAHGSPDSVGGRDPEEFAQLLLDRGLRDGTAIDLKACSTAVPSDSYVAQLEREILELSDGKVWVKILGYTGTHVITKEGGSLTKDPTKNVGALKDEYTKILNDHAAELEAARKYNEEAEKQGKSLQARAVEVAKLTASLFAALYAHNPKVAKGRESATGMSRTLSELDPLFGDLELLDLIRANESERWKGKPASYFA